MATAVALVVFTALVMLPGNAYAQNRTWNRNGSAPSGTSAWGSTSNWNGGGVPNASDVTAVFNNSTTTSTVLGDNFTLGNLTTASGRLFITGTDNNFATQAPPSAFQLIFTTTTGTAPRITNTGRVDMVATIAGSQGFTKLGAGTLYMWGTNVYSGTTTVSAGQIYLRNPDGLGATGAGNGTVVDPTGIVRIDASMTTAPEPLTISGTGHTNFGSLRTQAAGTIADFTGPITLSGSAKITAAPNTALTLSGSIDLGANPLQLEDAGDIIVSGPIGGTGAVTYQGTSPTGFTISGSNTFTGPITVGNAGGPFAMTGYLAGPTTVGGGQGRYVIGTGTFAGGLTVNNTIQLSPGESGTAASDSYGTITASTLTVQTANVLLGIYDSTIYDQLVMTAGSGGLTLGGSATLSLDFANTITSGTLNLLSFTGLSGNFQGVTSTGLYAGTWADSSGTWSLDGMGMLGSISATTTKLSFNQATGRLTFSPLPVNVSGTTVTFSDGGTVANPLTIPTGSAQVATNFLGSTIFSGTVAVGGTADLSAVAGGTATFTGIISGGGSVAKTGPGTVTFNAANTYTGATNVDAGKLLINGNQAAATGAVTVASGAALGGSGTTGGAVTINGTLSPGNSPGVLTVASVVLGASSTSFFEINGTTRGTDYDGVNITTAGGLTYDGALSLSFGNGSAFADNTTFDLFNFTGTPSGSFSSVTSTGFYAGTWVNTGGVWKLENVGAEGTQTLSFTQSTGMLAIVPEPSAFVLLSGGAVMATLIGLSRRRQSG